MEDFFKVVGGILFTVLMGLSLIFGGCYSYPKWNVYASKAAGSARLMEAESSKKIAIEEAKAKLESAKMLAEAEVERAKGIAEANKIIGDSLKDNESYLRYLWIDGLNKDSNQIIYVPTEAGLPILEAGRRP